MSYTATGKSPLILEPLIFSHVCRHWRYVALSIPMLWSTIWIDRPRPAHVPMVKLWLERSMPCPLSLHLRQSWPQSSCKRMDPHEYELTDVILHLLSAHINRWRVVDFSFSHEAHQPLLSLPKGPDIAPRLESVTLRFDSESWDPSSIKTVERTLYSNTSIRCMEFSFRRTPPSDIHVPWSQLTHLIVMFDCTIEVCMNLFASCPALVGLQLRCSSDIETRFKEEPLCLPTQVSPHRSLHLPNLRTVCLRADVDLGPMFDRLTLPTLYHLELTRLSLETIVSWQSLDELLARSACPLRSFRFNDGRGEYIPDLISYLEAPHLSTITKLHFQFPITDALLGAITPRTSGGTVQCLLPCLEVIVLHDLLDEEASADVVLDMISARSRSSPLRKVYLRGDLLPQLEKRIVQDIRQTHLDIRLCTVDTCTCYVSPMRKLPL